MQRDHIMPRIGLSLLLYLISALSSRTGNVCHAFSPIATFEQFSFASNGVCTNPSLFVYSPPATKTSDDLKVKSGGNIFTMRNVPGTGDCMFQAVILASLTSIGLGGNDTLLRAISRETRAIIARILQSDGNLIIEGNRLVPAQDLLASAAKNEGLSIQGYLEELQLEGREGGLYGGGPELTVLSNVLRRPISIYEVDSSEHHGQNLNEGECRIQCMGVFGGTRFEDPCANIPKSAILSGLQPGAYSWHLHILVLDVTSSGEKHACVLLPQDLKQ